MIDLHCHSTASDGSIPPEALPAKARSEGVTALALTDHDNTGGLHAFLTASQAIGFNGIPGVELSVSEDGLQCHIVGLYVNPDCGELQEKLSKIVTWRNERNEKILRALQDMGMPLTMDEVLAYSGEDHIVGRPHFAKALVAKGYCASIEGAFKKYLRRGRPAFFVRQSFGFHEAIQVLHQSGALAIWAHPLAAHNLTNAALARRLNAMKVLGLDGIEAYYPTHTANDTRVILRLAREKQLLVSGGTDYHGGGSHEGIELGIGYGKGFAVPDELLTRLEEYRCANRT